jgi:hypothetical protein
MAFLVSQQILPWTFLAPVPGMTLILEHNQIEEQSTEDTEMGFWDVKLRMSMHSM